MLPTLLFLLACGGPPTYIVEGVVVEVNDADVVLDHQAIEGFMGPMTMPFQVDDPALLADVEPGHRVVGRIAVDGTQITLEKLRVTGKGPVPQRADGPAALDPGDVLPPTPVAFHDGTEGTLGPSDRPTLLTFVYTRCPDPTYCPATLARLKALQPDLAGEVALVALTLDPEHDTVEVLAETAAAHGADPAHWRFARTSESATRELAMRAGIPVTRTSDGEIVHQLVWLLLDHEGRLVKRWESNALDEDAVRGAM